MKVTLMKADAQKTMTPSAIRLASSRSRPTLVKWVLPLIVGATSSLLSTSAHAQVESSPADDGTSEQRPQPVAPGTSTQPAAPPTPTPSGEASAPATNEAMHPDDHRVELAARGGLLFPGRMAPSNWLWVETNATPLFAFDLDWVVHRHVVLGAYLALAPISGERGVRTTYESDTSGFLASGGFTAKARFPIGDSVLLRGGLNFGRNGVSYSGTVDGASFEAAGGGFSAGLVADAVYRASKRFGASAQLGFLSQFAGSATVKGPPLRETGGDPDRSFGFAPIFFLTVGPELFL